MIYYLPPFVIPLLFLILYLNKIKRREPYAVIFYVINISMAFVLIYFVILGLYFQNYYMGPPFEIYHSLVISKCWMEVLGFFVLPLDIVYFFIYLKNRFKR
jgi:hypothetical protein